MFNWERHLSNRTVTAMEAINIIQPRQNILVSAFCNEPVELINQLILRKKELEKTNIFTLVQGGSCDYANSENARYFNTYTFLAGPQLKSSFKSGSSFYISTNISQIPRWLSENPMDIVFVQITPPNEEGYCSLGISVDYMKSAIQTGKIIIAEVNEQMPWSHGDTQVHVENIDYFVYVNHSLNTIEVKNETTIEKKIGENVADLVPHRATFQIGIGNIAESVLDSLNGKIDLGVHSGTYSDGMIKLIENGTITNRYKNIHNEKLVSTSVTGTKKIYDYINGNRQIELYPVDYTHNPTVLSKIDNFYSINSALEVDITGQVNSEKIGSTQIAGVGGQMDFIQGAKWSKGGRSIIAMPSTAKNDAISRIKLQVATVTTLKSEIDYIVTEYGVAKLFGKSLRDRVHEIASVAHPDYRKELLKNIDSFL